MIKKILIAIFLIATIAGCKKSGKDSTPSQPVKKPNTYSDKIILDTVIFKNDSSKLSWSTLDTSNFLKYTLYRIDNGSKVMVKEFFKREQTTFVDIYNPRNETILYQVVGSLYSGASISSNAIQFALPALKVQDINPFDVLYNKEDQLLYLITEYGRIAIYDLKKDTITKTIETNVTTGFSDLGTFNNKKELYVPRGDGYVYIYDAITLNKITQINVGTASSSVVFNNNNIFVSHDFSFSVDNAISVFNRATGGLVTQTGRNNYSRLKKVPNSNTNLLEISIRESPVDQDYFKFSADGEFLTKEIDGYHGERPLNPNIFEFFPDGRHYITSTEGAIYSQDMVYQGKLAKEYSYTFTTFAINQTSQLIYGGTSLRTIEVYSASNYSNIKSIKTRSYPFKLFDDDNKILCVSKIEQFSTLPDPNNPYNYSNKVVIEHINK